LTIAIGQVLTLFGDEGGDVDKADDVIRFRRGICDARPAVGVADGNHRTWYLLKQAGDMESVETPRSGLGWRCRSAQT
jgi:hypothetical protein